jgi:hypothetical protein
MSELLRRRDELVERLLDYNYTTGLDNVHIGSSAELIVSSTN